MKPQILEANLEASYEAFLSRHELASVYYSLKYRNFLKQLLSAKDHYLVAVENGEIHGILPLLYKDGFLGRVYNSLPFYGSHGGIVADNRQICDLLLSEYNHLIKGKDVAAANLISNPFFENDYSAILHGFTETRTGQLTKIDYAGDIKGSLLQSYDSKTRNIIRKAVNLGVTVVKDSSQKAFIQRVHKENAARIKIKPKSDLFFEGLDSHFQAGSDYEIYVAQSDEKFIGGLLTFQFNGVVEYFVPVIEHDYRGHQPLSLLIWEAMADAAKRGFKWWNWGGTSPSQQSVYEFKRKWGTVDKEYTYYNYINNFLVLESKPEDLLRDYEDFFVVPFNRLSAGN
jgi:hypothetical protein